MAIVLIPLYARAPLQTNRYARNGLYPDAIAQTFWQEETNRLLKLRTKSWSFFTPLDAIPATAGSPSSRVRWRAFIHTSSHHSHMQLRLVIASAKGATNPRVECAFTKSGFVLNDSVAGFYYGSGAASDSDVPNQFGVGDTETTGSVLVNTIDTLTADQDYEVLFTEYDGARIVSASMFEITKLADTDNGYLESGVQAGGPIRYRDRNNMVPLLRTVWKRNAAPLITWSVQQDSAAVTSSGPTKNVVDSSITTVSAASPGFTVDLRNCSTKRRASSGVPCIMRAYLDGSGAATISNLLLKDASGTTLATCSLTGTTAGWVSSGAFYLPASLAKYDLMVSQTSLGTASAFAASVYQYET